MSDWNYTVSEWSRPPVDDVGYVSTADLLQWPDENLKQMIETMRRTRYTGWRNHDGLWRDILGLDLTGRRILEYGCGIGMEAAELARGGNSVAIADLSHENLDLASRVMWLTGGAPYGRMIVSENWPFFSCMPGTFDVVNCSGVLHHIRKARLTMERFHEVLKPGGEVRLMLYSDVGWRLFAETEPPADDVENDPGFPRFVRAFDAVGDYATWYDEAKLNSLYGDLFTVDRFVYLTPNRQYCGAALTRKEGA